MNSNPRLLAILIFIITVVSAWIALPTNAPLNIPALNIDTNISRPWIPIPPIDRKLGWDVELQTGLDIQGGSQLVFDADMQDIEPGNEESALEATKVNIERRINLFGVSEPTVQTAQSGDQHRIIVELPGIEDATQALQLIGQTAQLDFREPNEGTDSALAFVQTELTGKNLKKSQVEFDPNTGEPVVRIQFDEQGAKLFADLTTKLASSPINQLAIFLDDQPLSFPSVNEPIITGDAVISGQFTPEDAKNLAVQLNAGALPVPIKLVQQQNIGATLGQTSVTQSVQAGLIGLALVMIFMAVYYGKLGLISDISLIIYGIITLALYKLTGITLTLPGIAGFILSVGMAVDANILIFERYKEEIRAGVAKHFAIEQAFGRAWDSIRDANICTIITCFVLYYLTSGAVRGFAVTLGLGIAISLFTGVVVTRTLIRLAFKRPRKAKLKK